MNGSNDTLGGQEPDEELLELRDIVVVETNDGEEIEFEVVGILQDEEGKNYAVCYSKKLDDQAAEDEQPQPFIVTDQNGNLISDAEVAQSILDEFLLVTDDEEEEEAGGQ